MEEQPPESLLAAMAAAADRDLVARQYVDEFALVLGGIVPQLAAGTNRGWSLTETIIHMHLVLIAEHGDSARSGS